MYERGCLNVKDFNSKNSNAVNDEDELTVKRLREGLDKLEQWNPVFTPNLQWFQQNVELEKKNIRKKQWKALLAFISVAVFVLSALIAIVYSQPVVFLYLQLVGIVLLPLAFNKNRKRVNNE